MTKALAVHFAATNIREAARRVVAIHDHARDSNNPPSFEAFARSSAALTVWEALTGTEGVEAVTAARIMAEMETVVDE